MFFSSLWTWRKCSVPTDSKMDAYLSSRPMMVFKNLCYLNCLWIKVYWQIHPSQMSLFHPRSTLSVLVAIDCGWKRQRLLGVANLTFTILKKRQWTSFAGIYGLVYASVLNRDLKTVVRSRWDVFSVRLYETLSKAPPEVVYATFNQDWRETGCRLDWMSCGSVVKSHAYLIRLWLSTHIKQGGVVCKQF